MSELGAFLKTMPVLPVVVVHKPKDALKLAECFLESGIGVMEITLRTPGALAAIEAVAQHFPDIRVGAGTVLQNLDIRQAQDAGAAFALSPGLTPGLLEASAACNMPFIPGAATASELMLARASGIRLCKVFPIRELGGAAYLKALSGPLSDMEFCPTGGIRAADVAEYRRLASVVTIGGSWFADENSIANQEWDTISRACKELVAQYRGGV